MLWNTSTIETFMTVWKLATVQECQLNRAEPREVKGNSYNFLKINGKTKVQSTATFLLTNVGIRPAAAQMRTVTKWTANI